MPTFSYDFENVQTRVNFSALCKACENGPSHFGQGGTRLESWDKFQTFRKRFVATNSAWPSQKLNSVPSAPWLSPGSGQLLCWEGSAPVAMSSASAINII